MKRVAGLDVHGKSCTFVVQNGKGETLSRGEFATTAEGVAEFTRTQKLRGFDVGMESGAVTPFVARQLAAAGARPVIIDAAEVRKKARSKAQKSDSRDAFEICDGLRRGIFVNVVHLPNATSQALRDALLARRHFVRIKNREVNAIKALLRKSGLATIYRTLASAAAFERLKAKPQIDASMRVRIEQHQALWNIAREQEAALDEELDRIAKVVQADVERLQTVPGVGPIVAMTALAYFAEPERFEDAKHAASYTGLVAQTYNSAERERYGHITRRGPKELRAMLVEAAHHARKKTHPLHAFYWRIAKKKGPKIALCAAAHQLARILWAMLKHKTPFDVRRLGIAPSAAWNELMGQTAEVK